MNQKMSYRDPVNIQGNIFYRLKTSDKQGKVLYSRVIVMKFNAEAVGGFRVYPNIICSEASINLSASHKDQASLMITDFNGRVLKQHHFQVQSGSNSISISGMVA